jgi:hypothetical protein
MFSTAEAQRRDDHAHSLRTYLSEHRKTLASFHSSGDLSQSDWADKYLHAARLHAAIVVELGGVVEGAPELQPEPEAPTSAVAAQPKQRCAFYRHIKAFMAVARERGLDISEAARDRMRGAIGIVLGRRIESRADLSGPEWELCTNALRAQRLFW